MLFFLVRKMYENETMADVFKLFRTNNWNVSAKRKTPDDLPLNPCPNTGKF